MRLHRCLAAFFHAIFALGLASVGIAHADAAPDEWSEREFLSEIPLIYSASRLPQQLDDTAGAVTVLDREFISMTGARDLTDLFRWVPGFQVATQAGGRSVVAYHGLSGQISQRMQVYVDGRSLYAPYLFGGVDWSVISVPLDDIERIEIQRGSNSVAYGANAFLGVISITTRSASQSVGWRVQGLKGSNGISDQHLRFGQAMDGVQWRLLAGRRSDDGLLNRSDSYRTEYLDFRAEFQPSYNEEWTLLSGVTRIRFSSGFETSVADPLRKEEVETASVNARYRYAIDPGHEWGVAVSWTRDSGNDSFDVPLLNASPLIVDGSRRANRYALEYQHFKDFSDEWRASWGGEYRHDDLISLQLFNTTVAQTTTALRAFINQEWKPSKYWTLNIGGLVESDRLSPSQFAPRLALNWKPWPEQTFKLGYSSAFRTPSLFEQKADWRIANEGRTLDIRYLSRGGLVPERIRALDLVYLGQWRSLGLTLDARVFREKITQLITGELYLLPPDQAYVTNAVAYDLRNNASVTNTGVEYQLSWRPWHGTLLLLNQYLAYPQGSRAAVSQAITKRSTGVFMSHAWGKGWSIGGGYTYAAPVLWLGESTPAQVQRLLSMRVAHAFRLNGSKVEMAASWRRPVGQTYEFRELQRLSPQFWLSMTLEY